MNVAGNKQFQNYLPDLSRYIYSSFVGLQEKSPTDSIPNLVGKLRRFVTAKSK
jgi:hypothetical protein